MDSSTHAILIVEDERIVAKDLQQTLCQMGYDAYAIAASSDEAMKQASLRRPDVVLMDIRIKGTRDGVATAALLREMFGVPVVYLTAHADPATIARAKLTEPYGYLVKPVKSAELRSVIEVSMHRHDADRRVRERERWLSTTLRSIGDAVIAVDPGGLVSFMNPAAERLLGGTATEAVGRPIKEVMQLRQEGADDPSPLEEALRKGLTIELPECTLHTKDRGVRTICDSASPVIDNGVLLGAVMVFRDITDEKRAQARLELTDRLASLGTMAAAVAHEVNNPLLVITANSEYIESTIEQALADDRAVDDASDLRVEPLAAVLEESRALQAEIRFAASRIARIVNDLRAFSQPRETREPSADITRAMQWALRVTAHELRHRASTALEMNDTRPVALDETRLGQVLVNLVVNAALAQGRDEPRESVVRIATSIADDATMMITVQDSGCGIPPEILPHIFEPFFTTRGQGSGTGLGLSVCHGIVASAGGRIEVESKVAHGTTFRVFLPVAASVTATASAPAFAAPAITRARVLVIDDEDLILRVMQRVLGPHHDLVCVTSAKEALALIDGGSQFDVVFTDLVMPGMSGPQLFERLSREHPDVATKLVFLSGGAVDDGISGFLSRVANPCLHKPFEIEALHAAVHAMIGG